MSSDILKNIFSGRVILIFIRFTRLICRVNYFFVRSLSLNGGCIKHSEYCKKPGFALQSQLKVWENILGLWLSFSQRLIVLWTRLVNSVIMFSVYFAKSLKNNKIYVGFTDKEPDLRVKEHSQGTNSWSRKNRPFKLVYFKKYYCEKDARLRERFYKTGIGKAYKKLIIGNIDSILGL